MSTVIHKVFVYYLLKMYNLFGVKGAKMYLCIDNYFLLTQLICGENGLIKSNQFEMAELDNIPECDRRSTRYDGRMNRARNTGTRATYVVPWAIRLTRNSSE